LCLTKKSLAPTDGAAPRFCDTAAVPHDRAPRAGGFSFEIVVSLIGRLFADPPSETAPPDGAARIAAVIVA